MLSRGAGLIVGLTDGDPDEYHDHLLYDLPKKSVMRLAVAYAHELGPYGITGLALSPGWLRSERMLDQHGVTEQNWQDWYWDAPQQHPPVWLASESPRYTGRAVVALATDPDVARWNGQAVKTANLAGIYGVHRHRWHSAWPRSPRLEVPDQRVAQPRGLSVKPSRTRSGTLGRRR